MPFPGAASTDLAAGQPRARSPQQPAIHSERPAASQHKCDKAGKIQQVGFVPRLPKAHAVRRDFQKLDRRKSLWKVHREDRHQQNTMAIGILTSGTSAPTITRIPPRISVRMVIQAKRDLPIAPTPLASI